MTATIDPRAEVDPRARLGAAVHVGPFCIVGPDVEIGDGARLLSHVVLDGAVKIGARCVVHPFARLGGAPQDRADVNGEPRVEIGENCVIREHVTIHRGTDRGGGFTRVGPRAYLMAGSHVGHDARLGADVVLTNNAALGGHAQIGDGVVIGGQSAVHQKCRVGAGAFVAGMCGVWADVAPNAYAIGDRARLEGLNVIGLRRRGWAHARILGLRRIHAFLFEGEGTFAERAATLEERFPDDPDAAELAEFVAGANGRPILQPSRRRGGPKT